MSSFFSYFPSLIYDDKAVTNVIAKVKFKESILRNAALFYPYTVVDNERPDQIAERYYNDSSYDWVIYMSNDITDPYYEWPRSDEEVNNLLITKYGTVANSQTQISHYMINYSTDDRVISTAAYEALATSVKKYWQPIVGYNDVVINYQRKPLDMFVETNRVVGLTGAFSNVYVNDVVTQDSARGTVAFANATNITVRHTTGSFANGVISQGTVTNVTVISETIPSDEYVYWTSVSAYEAAHMENESRKTIQILSPTYLDIVERDMKELLTK